MSCQNGWGNHGGVGHSSKRIWLAALPRGIKTGWADQPLLLSMFHDQVFIMMAKRYMYCVQSCHHQVPAVLTQLREAVTECASKFPVPVHPVIICFSSQCTWIVVQFSWAAFIGRTSKCRTTKLLWQICSHHNRPDEGILQQFSRECCFEWYILLRRTVAKYKSSLDKLCLLTSLIGGGDFDRGLNIRRRDQLEAAPAPCKGRLPQHWSQGRRSLETAAGVQGNLKYLVDKSLFSRCKMQRTTFTWPRKVCNLSRTVKSAPSPPLPRWGASTHEVL